MNTPRRLSWSSAARSHVGMVRKVNEDSCLDLPEQGLWAVADGMGGHEAGDMASQMIVDNLRQLAMNTEPESLVVRVKDCLHEVNRTLREEAARRYSRGTIGSTVVVLMAQGEQATLLWVGDSRVYRFRQGKLEQLSRDHSHVQDLVDQGLLRPADAERHPMANVITRAVGAGDGLEIDSRALALKAGDTYLLCSDGLTKTIGDEEIAKVLGQGDSHDAVKTLIHAALMEDANDNVTTVVVRINGDGDDDEDDGDYTIPRMAVKSP